MSAGSFADVILPLALPKPYTYHIPVEFLDTIAVGKRVEVSFGQKIYSGLVMHLHHRSPETYSTKPLLSVIDDQPIVIPQQLLFWQWLASYYCCTIGEIMNAALPSHFKLNSETVIALHTDFDDSSGQANTEEFLLIEALTLRKELRWEEIQLILNKKTVSPLIRRMMDKGMIIIKEELREKYKPKQVALIRIHPDFQSEEKLNLAFEAIKQAPKQTEALLAVIQLTRNTPYLRPQEVMDLSNCEASVIQRLVEKGILEKIIRSISRIEDDTAFSSDAGALSAAQNDMLGQIRQQFRQHDTVLLHGVTGSGKTRIYIELIREVIEQGGQVLYLLPEIALTTQIIQRLKVIFGNDIAVYHSRLGNQERVEIWNAALQGKAVFLGVRSALFLPYKHLQLLIVDEEHDPSYKQSDPHPRYHARDAAIFFAQHYRAKVLLGTATPAIETYYNAQQEKYGYVALKERFGGVNMPAYLLADIRDELKKRRMQSHFTSILLDQIRATLENREQVILFQNRRGYAPVLQCLDCGWNAMCKNCDVALTYHRHTHNLHCHYCGFQTALAKACPACGSMKINTKGYGTEKLEDEIAVYFPEARIARMDLDTVRSKHALTKIINDFEEHRVDILVGTQMVTKGLDFDNVGVVGVINADQHLRQPDFRAAERAFQLITQVSGRAGRKSGSGKVVIQTYEVGHPVLKEILRGDYDAFYRREIQERRDFRYPPFVRLIQITLKHRKNEKLQQAVPLFTQYLKQRLGDQVYGPALPPIPRLRDYYLMEWTLKLEKNATRLAYAKQVLLEADAYIQSQPGLSSLRVVIDVDPV